MIYFFVPDQYADHIDDYVTRLDTWGAAHMAKIGYRDAIERTEFGPGRYVFTGLDRLGPAATVLLTQLHDQLRTGLGIPPVNHPGRSLRRFELLKTLHEHGTNRFRALGAWQDLSDLHYPAFVRHRSKDGGVPQLLRSRREVDREIGRALVGGADLEELLVVEFLDTAGSDGFYRKYSAYCIDGKVFPVSVDRGVSWVMRAIASERTPEAVAEEREYLEGDPHRDQISRIFELAEIGFGRIDYSLLDGQIQTWEINTLPMLRRPPGQKDLPAEIQRLRAYRKELTGNRFREAWEAVDSWTLTRDCVEVSYEPDVLEAGRRELARAVPSTYPAGPRYALARRLLRPLKPILKPLAERFVFPLLSKHARVDGPMQTHDRD